MWEAQEFGHGCTKFEFLIRHVFLFYVELCIQIGELVVFLFQYDSLPGTESFHNSLAGTETMVEGRGGFECFCLNRRRQGRLPGSVGRA